MASRALRCAVLLTALVCVARIAPAQETVDRSVPPIGGFIDRPVGGGTDGGNSPIFPSVWCADVDDEATADQCWQSYRASLRYYETGLDHRSAVFEWQHFSTQVIFFVVLGLVLVGVIFAWVQFRQGMADAAARAKQAGKGESPVAPPSDAAEHEIEISTTGIKVSSPVLGVVILSLSLAFFYLYLIYVYPITESF